MPRAGHVIAPQSRGATWRRTWPAAMLVLLVLVTYIPVLDADFITDDDVNVTANPTLYSATGLRDMWLVPTAAQQFYPITYSTFWIETRLWGRHPRGFHVVNVLIHATNAVLLWHVLKALRLPGSWFAAAIFAVHPVEVESVAWITERRNLLSMAFALGSLLCYVRFAPTEVSAGSAKTLGRGRWYAASLALFAAALLSKTAVVTLPAVILVIEWWRRGRLTRHDLALTAPYFALAFALGSVTLWLEKNHVGAQGSEFDLSFAERFLVAGRAIWFYAGKLLWPYPTMFFYPRWTMDPRVWWQWVFPAAALAVPAILWVTRKRIGRGPLAAVLIYVGVLMPTLGFLNVYFHTFSFVADHFQYHASPALFALAAAALTAVFVRLAPDAASVVPRNLFRVTAGAILIALGVLSFRAAGHFHDEETLYRDTLAKNPASWGGWSNLGMQLGEQGRYAEALDAMTHAIEIDPGKSRVQYNYAKLLLDRGERAGFGPDDLADAYAHFREAARLTPGWALPEVGMGLVLLRENRTDEAAQQLEHSLALEPENVDALLASGLLCSQRGATGDAQKFFARAVELDPQRPESHYGLGQVLAEQGNLRGAVEQLADAVRLRPDYPAAWSNRGAVHARLGDADAAVECFEQAARLEPNSPQAQENLAKVREWKRQLTRP